MKKLTINELYYGDDYNIMGKVFKKVLLSHDKTMDEQTRLELEIVRQTVVTIEQILKEGDSVIEVEIGDGVATFMSMKQKNGDETKR